MNAVVALQQAHSNMLGSIADKRKDYETDEIFADRRSRRNVFDGRDEKFGVKGDEASCDQEEKD